MGSRIRIMLGKLIWLIFVVVEVRGQEVCNTPECRLAAESILSSLDVTAEPCSDFYQFACGGWIAKNSIPEGKSTPPAGSGCSVPSPTPKTSSGSGIVPRTRPWFGPTTANSGRGVLTYCIPQRNISFCIEQIVFIAFIFVLNVDRYDMH